MTHVFFWMKSGMYGHWHDRKCRIITCSRVKCDVEFENGERCITLVRALRKLH